MEIKQILTTLETISRSPKLGTDEYSGWLEQEEFLHFLLDTKLDEVLLYSAFENNFVYSVNIPERSLVGDYVDDLMKWHASPSDSWGYGYSSNKGREPKYFISKAFDLNRSKMLEKAQPITYLRHFEGRSDRKGYVEVSQFLIHLHDIHFMEERQAYCKLNKDGDIEDVIKILYPPQGGYMTTIKEDVLDFHLFLNKSVLVRFFDRFIFDRETGLSEKSREETVLNDKSNEIYCRRVIFYNKDNMPMKSLLRGFQIIRNRQPRNTMLAKLTGKDLEPKKYETFITWDWKHKKIAELSCNPADLGNYFVESDKPFQTSPVFFKSDVLLKYKQDTEKYTLAQRYITCRNSWHLTTYDINEAGQVFTYLCYLGDLPHNEQLHWKQYNENPKSGISERALKTDFKAEWDLSYEPLSELKSSLENLYKMKQVWTCRDTSLYSQLNYVVSDSIKEWSDEIQTLDKLVIEGLNRSYLKKLSESLKCYDDKLGSIKLLGEILKIKGINTQEIEQIVSPLEEIQHLRTKFSAHVTGTTEKTQIRKKIVSQYGTLKDHFRNLVERTDKGIKLLVDLISRNILDI